MRKRLRVAEEIGKTSSHEVKKISNLKWKLESQTNPGTYYIVEKQCNLSEKCKCKLVCTPCGI